MSKFKEINELIDDIVELRKNVPKIAKYANKLSERYWNELESQIRNSNNNTEHEDLKLPDLNAEMEEKIKNSRIKLPYINEAEESIGNSKDMEEKLHILKIMSDIKESPITRMLKD